MLLNLVLAGNSESINFLYDLIPVKIEHDNLNQVLSEGLYGFSEIFINGSYICVPYEIWGQSKLTFKADVKKSVLTQVSTNY